MSNFGNQKWTTWSTFGCHPGQFRPVLRDSSGVSNPINISRVTGHVCTSVHSESVYSNIRMWLLNGVKYNVWEKLPFAVWRDVWNWIQLQVWEVVDWTGMETTSTHNLMVSEIVSNKNVDLCPQCLQFGVSPLESLLEVSH